MKENLQNARSKKCGGLSQSATLSFFLHLCHCAGAWSLGRVKEPWPESLVAEAVVEVRLRGLFFGISLTLQR